MHEDNGDNNDKNKSYHKGGDNNNDDDADIEDEDHDRMKELMSVIVMMKMSSRIISFRSFCRFTSWFSSKTASS